MSRHPEAPWPAAGRHLVVTALVPGFPAARVPTAVCEGGGHLGTFHVGSGCRRRLFTNIYFCVSLPTKNHGFTAVPSILIQHCRIHCGSSPGIFLTPCSDSEKTGSHYFQYV